MSDNSVIISCKKATYLISKQQETKISFADKIRLNFHTLICDVCSQYKAQTTYFLNKIKSQKKQAHSLNILSKQKIKLKVNEIISTDN